MLYIIIIIIIRYANECPLYYVYAFDNIIIIIIVRVVRLATFY